MISNEILAFSIYDFVLQFFVMDPLQGMNKNNSELSIIFISEENSSNLNASFVRLSFILMQKD
jgi:hypothetical protein